MDGNGDEKTKPKQDRRSYKMVANHGRDYVRGSHRGTLRAAVKKIVGAFIEQFPATKAEEIGILIFEPIGEGLESSVSADVVNPLVSEIFAECQKPAQA